nr:PREDICTED: protein TOC75-3, chloroplastic-like isoform X2 [Musa acuminata subsp. malaccensis]
MAFAAPTQLLGPQIHSSAAAPRRRKYMPNDGTIVPTTIIVRARKKSLAAAPWTRKHIPYGRTIGPTTIVIRVCKKYIAPFSASVVSVAAAAAGGFILISSFPPSPPPIDGGGGGGGWFRGGGGDGGGGFWSNLFSPFVALAKEEGGGGHGWDPHGLPANIVVQLNKLSGLKRYKISEILFFDRRRSTTVAGTNDSFFEMVSLRNGGVYTKAQLQKEVENLASSGMFEKVDLEGKTKPDGTMALTVSFTESTWQSADAFRCINVGLLPQTKQMEMDADMTEREKLEYFRIQEREYKRRIDRSRPCLLPVTVQREVLQMLRERGKVSARLLQRIRDRVQKWYHDEGYACAQVVNFGNLNTREVVCEVVEGDITQLNIQFLDKLGNLCEGNTQLAVIRRELPRQLRSGHVFNIEAGKQALRNINSLSLFSNIEVNPRPDEKKEGGIIVEIKLREMDQKSAEVSIEWSLVPGRHGQPTLASIQPGGTISFEHRNIKGLNRSIVGSVTSSNLLNPQVDQGLGIGSNFPFFNRHQLTLTRFIPLKQVEEGIDKSAPPVLVLHGHYGSCVGDLASYDAFTLGGPYSVRGYNMGELGACRNILELAAELRIPIKKTHVYLFAEHGNDLGSSKDVKGNPTEFFRRAGHGSSYGAGLKLGMVRAEYAVDHNTDTGAVFLRFGERF